ncbi:DNA polymerase I, partial [Halorubrum sp. SS5]
SLSRWPDVDYQQLASRSTYSSYGRVGHSPARYNVPGRAIIDESNTFFYGETNLDGVLDLVSRSNKPVQELAWASIGNVLTAIQICEAHDRDVLVPWNSWRHEFYKPMGTLHDADRGGFIFA